MHETFAVYKEHPVGVVLGLLQHSSYNHIYALYLWVLCVGTILFAYYMIISKAEFQTSISGRNINHCFLLGNGLSVWLVFIL